MSEQSSAAGGGGIVPAVVLNKAVAVGAGEWLSELPDLIVRLEQEWGFVTGRPFADATEAFVAEALLADGTPAVLKLVVPRDGDAARNEITALELVAGEGCPVLYRSCTERGALLMERLGRPMSELRLAMRKRHEILCDAARRIWRPVPGSTFPTGADKARALVHYIRETWEDLDRPCSAAAVEQAVECAGRREIAHDDERSVLVHGDVHQWNALEAGDGTYKLVDPDGLMAEPEYDLGILMREDPIELMHGDPRERSRWLAVRTGLDETAIWEWGVVERVSTGLLCTKVDLQPVGREMLQAADVVARRRDG